MRYLLDTNIVVFVLSNNYDNTDIDTRAILEDYSSLLFMSSVSLIELTQLFRIGKIKSKKYKSSTEMAKAIEEEFGIKILPFVKEHGITLTKLDIAENHNDPFDHAIISHAISEKLTLVSSDRQFEKYTSQKLNFVFNKR
ncbi:MAG: type II toxin-antitoxin system VapC family toxin, partial [Bergeyella sp.]